MNSVLPGPTKSRGAVDFAQAMTQGGGKSFEEFETEFFEKVRPTSLIKRFEVARRGRLARDLPRKPAGVGDHGRSAEGRRRRREERLLEAFSPP